MEIRWGVLPLPGLPQELPVGQKSKLLIQGSSHEDTILLRDDVRGLHQELADLVRDLIWCFHEKEQVLILGSQYGHHVYLLKVDKWQVSCDILIFRDKNPAWNRMGILPTPDGMRVLIISDWTAHLLSWSGEVSLEGRIQPNHSVRKLERDSLTLYDHSNGKELICPFPALPVEPFSEAAPQVVYISRQALISSKEREPTNGMPERDENELRFHGALPKADQPVRQRMQKGTPLAELYLQTPAGDFPCQGWEGEPFLLVATWVKEAALLMSQTGVRKQLIHHFLTGPYFIEGLRSSEEGAITLRFLRSYVTGPIDILPPITLQIAHYCQQILFLAQSLLHDSRIAKQGDDFELGVLEKNTEELRNNLLAHNIRVEGGRLNQ